ncbi:PLDc N-terminal domain-containing protein [Gordonia alkanivorans]|uniref:PLDc N-terminal domain-containing protein n=1 Tax=Gordonia alkanivorans TaxID=84096 RepID=UPI00244980AD|nr:PLDc N-terminal domain-containing protein [Gordonia alkanivorans]MDH3043853.1 PLDc N-terminal domain-containing protein [Gordonia alkanivorans]
MDKYSAVLAAADDNTSQQIVTIALFGALAVAALALLALVIAAMVSIARSASYNGIEKICWAGIVIIFPLVGSLAWFGAGRRMREVG